MWERVQNLLAMWRAAQSRRRFEDGWDWAAGELLRGRSVDSVREQLTHNLFNDDPDSAHFDKGANAAVEAWLAMRAEGTA